MGNCADRIARYPWPANHGAFERDTAPFKRGITPAEGALDRHLCWARAFLSGAGAIELAGAAGFLAAGARAGPFTLQLALWTCAAAAACEAARGLVWAAARVARDLAATRRMNAARMAGAFGGSTGVPRDRYLRRPAFYSSWVRFVGDQRRGLDRGDIPDGTEMQIDDGPDDAFDGFIYACGRCGRDVGPDRVSVSFVGIPATDLVPNVASFCRDCYPAWLRGDRPPAIKPARSLQRLETAGAAGIFEGAVVVVLPQPWHSPAASPTASIARATAMRRKLPIWVVLSVLVLSP